VNDLKHDVHYNNHVGYSAHKIQHSIFYGPETNVIMEFNCIKKLGMPNYSSDPRFSKNASSQAEKCGKPASNIFIQVLIGPHLDTNELNASIVKICRGT
jgi:hypothetical protein